MGSVETTHGDAWESASTESLGGSASPRGPSSPSFEPDSVIAGKYRLMGRIGGGGMGVVYEAFHLKLRKAVAIKIPFTERLSPTAAARLFREARVASGLDPERTARVLDVGALDDGTPFLVMEKLEGENLAQLLAREGPRPVVEAVDLVAEACLGVAGAHRGGIVHRDLKPSNLFLARGSGATSLKVLDFGIASPGLPDATLELEVDPSLTRSGSTLGSPPYMAPEQLRSANAVDPRADVWALGVTLHQLMTGKLPFPGSGAGLIAAIVADPPLSPRKSGAEIPDGLDRLLARCLAKHPGKRPRDAAALAEELSPFASPAVRRAIARELGSVEAAAPPRFGRRLASAFAAIAVVAGVATWVGTTRRPPTVAPEETHVAREETAGPPATTVAAREPLPPTAAETTSPLEANATETPEAAPSTAPQVRKAASRRAAPAAGAPSAPAAAPDPPARAVQPPAPTAEAAPSASRVQSPSGLLDSRQF